MDAPVPDFLAALAIVARPVGQGSYAFVEPNGSCRGFVQIIVLPHRITIHRLWTRQPGGGHGRFILRALCDLADRHQVELSLKPLPIGRKPYPLSRDQLLAWYQRHGFAGTRRKMIRPPGKPADTSNAAGRGHR
jgi:hypothetical protein